MTATLKAKDVKPSEDGFFSKNLYKWLKKHPDYNRIYEGVWHNIDGYNPDKKVLYIGIITGDGWFYGNRLTMVCSGSRLDTTPMAFHPSGFHVYEWVDVTELFIRDYKLIGVCAIHGDNAHRLDDLSKTERVCLNCGAIYERKTKRVTKHFWERTK